jgi:tetratricopeptide (TPR) repeat protein
VSHSLARAVNHLHCRGVLHQDIKTENILMTANGKPVLSDFGVSSQGKALQLESAPVSNIGGRAGGGASAGLSGLNGGTQEREYVLEAQLKGGTPALASLRVRQLLMRVRGSARELRPRLLQQHLLSHADDVWCYAATVIEMYAEYGWRGGHCFADIWAEEDSLEGIRMRLPLPAGLDSLLVSCLASATETQQVMERKIQQTQQREDLPLTRPPAVVTIGGVANRISMIYSQEFGEIDEPGEGDTEALVKLGASSSYLTAERVGVIHNNLGLALHYRKLFVDAFVQYEHAIAVSAGTDARAYNNLGAAMQALGRIAEAKAHYRHAHELDHNHPCAEGNLARLEYRPTVGSECSANEGAVGDASTTSDSGGAGVLDLSGMQGAWDSSEGVAVESQLCYEQGQRIRIRARVIKELGFDGGNDYESWEQCTVTGFDASCGSHLLKVDGTQCTLRVKGLLQVDHEPVHWSVLDGCKLSKGVRVCVTQGKRWRQGTAELVSFCKFAAASAARVAAEDVLNLAFTQMHSLNKLREQSEAAGKALNAIKRDDIHVLKNLSNPASGIKRVMEMTCILLGARPIRGGAAAVLRQVSVHSQASLLQAGILDPPQSPVGEDSVQLDYWAASIKLLKSSNFYQQLKRFDIDSVSEEIMEQLAPHVRSPAFEMKEVGKVSKCATGLCKWVHAVYAYHRTLAEQNLTQSRSERANWAHELMIRWDNVPRVAVAERKREEQMHRYTVIKVKPACVRPAVMVRYAPGQVLLVCDQQTTSAVAASVVARRHQSCVMDSWRLMTVVHALADGSLHLLTAHSDATNQEPTTVAPSTAVVVTTAAAEVKAGVLRNDEQHFEIDLNDVNHAPALLLHEEAIEQEAKKYEIYLTDLHSTIYDVRISDL